jgi:signal transduction histidine kinase
MRGQKLFVILITLSLFVPPLAKAAARRGTEKNTIQTIVKKWAAVERLFLSGENTGLFEEIDGFRGAVEQFLESQTYGIYRYFPFSQKEEVPQVASLALSFREAVFSGDRERALSLSLDIHDALVLWQELAGEAEEFIDTAYLELFLIFTGLIILFVLTLWFLHRALTRSQKSERNKSVYSQALVLAQEEERSRIARELHDTVAQELRYVALMLGKIGRSVGPDVPDGGERSGLCTELAAIQTGLIKRVRNICDGLIPPDFRFQGLPDALRRLCHDFGSRTGSATDCRIDVEEPLPLDTLDEEMQLQVFRIVQEALTNIERHAQAREAVVVVRRKKQSAGGPKTSGGPEAPGWALQVPSGGVLKVPSLFVSVSDDGRGFDVPRDLAELPQGHLGIRGMYERAAILSAALKIESERGEGTTLLLEVPLAGGGEAP